MAQGQNKKANIFNALLLIPSLIQLAQATYGKGNQEAKHNAVVGTTQAFMIALGGAAAANNPAYAAYIGAIVSQLVPPVKTQMAENPDVPVTVPVPVIPFFPEGAGTPPQAK